MEKVLVKDYIVKDATLNIKLHKKDLSLALITDHYGIEYKKVLHPYYTIFGPGKQA